MDWLTTLLSILAIGLALLLYRNMTYWRNKGIPYVSTFPIIGAFSPIFFRRMSMIQMLSNMYYAYPGAKYYATLDFGSPVIFLKDPEMVKEITIKSFDFFPNHRSFVEAEFDPLLGRNIFSLKNERWREMRTTLSPSFTANKMKFLFTLVSKVSQEFVRHLREHPEISEKLDMKDAYTRYTNDVIASSAFGVSVNSMQERDNEFYINGLDASSFDGFAKLIKFLAARAFPRFMQAIGITFLSRKTDTFFKSLIHDTVNQRQEKGIVRPDMIHLLMQARDNENGIEMTTDDIIAQAFIFFLAGFETSARLMCFVTHILAFYPDVQERLRREVDEEVAEDGSNVTYETLAKMKYLDMVVSETLRLYPPMPFTDRVCTKPYTLPSSKKGYGDFTVQPNTSLWIPVWGFHHDPDYFPDPEKFDPERFSEENKNDIKPGTYIPFGIGPRRCIGDRFALMEIKILVTHLLQNFVIKPSPGTRREIVFTKKSFNMVPDCGFWVQLVKRQ